MGESEEKLIKAIKHYQDSLERHTKTGNAEKLNHAIEKLARLPIKVCHLEETGVGRTVNGLKKFDGSVGENARSLVDKWKSMVKGEEEEQAKHLQEQELAIEQEMVEDEPDTESLQIVDPEEKNHSDNQSVEINNSSLMKSSSSNKNSHNSSSSRHSNGDKRSRSQDRHEQKYERDESSDDSHNDNSDSSSNHASKKHKSDKSESVKSKKSSHKNQSEEESSSAESDSDDSESSRESSPRRTNDKKKSGRSYSESSDRTSSDSKQSSSEDSSSDDDKKHKSKNHRNHKKRHSSSSQSDSDTKSSDKLNKVKEKSSKHTKSGSENDRGHKNKNSQSKEKHCDSKEHSSKSRDKSKDNPSKSQDTKSDRRDKDRESSSKKDCSTARSKSKSDENRSKHKHTNSEKEKSKHRDSDRDSRNSSSKSEEKKKEELKKESSKSSKENSKTTRDKKRSRESSTEIDAKRRKEEPAENKDSKKKSNEPSREKEISDKKRDSRKDKTNDRSDTKKSRDSSSTKSSKDKEKPKTPKIGNSSSKQLLTGIDSGSGTSFADVLGMLEAPVYTKSKKKSTGLEEKHTSERSSTSAKEDRPSKSRSSAEGSSSIEDNGQVPNLLQDPSSLEPLDINISSLLPSITPNYRPLGVPLDTQNKKMWSDDEALTRVITAKHQRTKVYSGNKCSYTKLPSLFEICSRILQDNLDALEYTGGVPYSILKHILEKANPDQLYQLEFHNPYLIEDTDELWQLHCQKEFRNKRREELESWREMYMRCLDEREAKLKALTANIKQSQEKYIPVRQTKLAYVDSVVKPPRNIARKQAKNGTAVEIKKPSQTPAERLSQLAKSGEAAKIAVPNPARGSSSSSSHNSHIKPKKAPLMAKTLSLLKNRFGRR